MQICDLRIPEGRQTHADGLEHRHEPRVVLHAGSEGGHGGLEEGERAAQRGDAVAVHGVGGAHRHGVCCCVARRRGGRRVRGGLSRLVCDGLGFDLWISFWDQLSL